MASYQRARKAGEKQQRRQAILDAAWEMFQATPYDALAMASVAEQIGLAKGTMYLYFATKEELFLALAEREMSAWFDEVAARLSEERPRWDIPDTVGILCATLDARPGLTRLLAILSTVLEQNIDLESAIRFKRMVLAHMLQIGALLERRLPFLAPGEGMRVLLRAHALIVGLRHLADPAPVIREALRQPDLAPFNISFADELAASVTALLWGMRARKQP
ncbi:MAG: TetR family transcriptional regulator [Nitrososphaerota archaeon]